MSIGCNEDFCGSECQGRGLQVSASDVYDDATMFLGLVLLSASEASFGCLFDVKKLWMNDQNSAPVGVLLVGDVAAVAFACLGIFQHREWWELLQTRSAEKEQLYDSMTLYCAQTWQILA